MTQPELFVASPLYAAQCDSIYKNSIIALQSAMMREGVIVHFKDIVNQSLIPRARNTLVALMKETPATHLLFLDGDIAINPHDVLMMLHLTANHGYDVVAAPCPKKVIDWESVKQALAINQNLTVKQLMGCCGSMNFNRNSREVDYSDLPLDKPVEVEEIGTGVMMIKRRVFDLLENHFSDEWYYDQYSHLQDRGAKIYDHFPVSINKSTRTLLPEDYGFCNRWRSIGGKVYMCPWIKTHHAGRNLFSGNLEDIAQCLMTEKTEVTG